MKGCLSAHAIVVTGAGRGLGAAYAADIARCGGRVIVNDRDADAAVSVANSISASGGTALADHADVASWEGAASVIDHCTNAFGQLDGLVNNAGIFAMATAEESDEPHIRSIMETNVMSTLFCGVHALRVMQATQSGAIVNVTSGALSGRTAMGAYGASKAAIASVTYTWAREVAGSPVRVNGVSPLARTRMTDERIAYVSRKGGSAANDGSDPGRLAPVVSCLLSDRARGINGHIFRVTDDALSLLSPTAVARSEPGDAWTVDAAQAAMSRLLGT